VQFPIILMLTAEAMRLSDETLERLACCPGRRANTTRLLHKAALIRRTQPVIYEQPLCCDFSYESFSAAEQAEVEAIGG
jgi:hypothetical protein